MLPQVAVACIARSPARVGRVRHAEVVHVDDHDALVGGVAELGE